MLGMIDNPRHRQPVCRKSEDPQGPPMRDRPDESAVRGATHLAAVYAGLGTRRWHANPALAATGQTIADHQGRCIALLLAIHPCAPSAALVAALALHDLGEAFAGDLPAGFKRQYPDIAQAHAVVEAELSAQALGWDLPWLTEAEGDWLRLIDRLDAAAWCLLHAPAEYAREASGWPGAEMSLLALADRLGVVERVLEFLGDLKGGRW
jgi:5'-deoxynucleotidase YfbR-like HD superfamily hydrolase